MAIGWWYLRRSMRRRAERAVAGIVSGEALGLVAARKRLTWWKWLLALSVVGGLGWLAWRRFNGDDGDDWSSWEPSVPEPPVADVPAPDGSPVVAPESAVPAAT